MASPTLGKTRYSTPNSASTTGSPMVFECVVLPFSARNVSDTAASATQTPPEHPRQAAGAHARSSEPRSHSET